MGAPAALARASGAALIPVRCVRLAPQHGHYTLLAEPPIELDRSLAPKAAKSACLRAMNAVYSRWIREHPEQWAWYQPRWRTQPGERQSVPLAARQRGQPSKSGS